MHRLRSSLLLALAATHAGVALAQDAPSIAFPGSATLPTQVPRLTQGNGKTALSWIETGTDGRHALRFAFWHQDGFGAARTIAEGEDWFVNWADYPSLAIGRDGRLLAHWLQRLGDGTYAYGVRMRGSADGVDWGSPFWLHDDRSPTEHGFASLVALESGDFGAVWLDGREMANHGPMTLRTRRVGIDGPVSPEVLIDAQVCECCRTAACRTKSGMFAAYRDRSTAEIRDIYGFHLGEAGAESPLRIHEDGWRVPG